MSRLLPTFSIAALLLGAACASTDAIGVETSVSESRRSACEATSPRPNHVSTVVTPDDGDGSLLDLLDGAERSVNVMIYSLSSRRVIEALERAAARPGVHVRVLQDGDHAVPGIVDELRASHVDIRLRTNFENIHQKTVVVDGRSAFIFSGNLDRKSFFSNRNYGVIDDDPEDVADLEALFEADWSERSPDLACTRLLVAPNNARQRLIDLIQSARTRLDIEALYVTDPQIVRTIIEVHERAPAPLVRVLVNDPAFGFGSDDGINRLKHAGIDVRHSVQPEFIHAKLVMVDTHAAFVGSTNLSFTGLNRNREAGIVLTDDSARLSEAFEADWQRAQPFAP